MTPCLLGSDNATYRQIQIPQLIYDNKVSFEGSTNEGNSKSDIARNVKHSFVMDRPGGQASSPNLSAPRISSLAKLAPCALWHENQADQKFWGFEVVAVLQIRETFGMAFYNHKWTFKRSSSGKYQRRGSLPNEIESKFSFQSSCFCFWVDVFLEHDNSRDAERTMW